MSESRLNRPTKLPGIFSVSILAFLLAPYFLSPHLDKLLISPSTARLSQAPPPRTPQDSELGLEIDRVIDEVIAASPTQLEQYRSGKETLFGFFVGQVMKASKGKANPKIVNERLKEKLK